MTIDTVCKIERERRELQQQQQQQQKHPLIILLLRAVAAASALLGSLPFNCYCTALSAFALALSFCVFMLLCCFLLL